MAGKHFLDETGKPQARPAKPLAKQD